MMTSICSDDIPALEDEDWIDKLIQVLSSMPNDMVESSKSLSELGINLGLLGFCEDITDSDLALGVFIFGKWSFSIELEGLKYLEDRASKDKSFRKSNELFFKMSKNRFKFSILLEMIAKTFSSVDDETVTKIHDFTRRVAGSSLTFDHMVEKFNAMAAMNLIPADDIPES